MMLGNEEEFEQLMAECGVYLDGGKKLQNQDLFVGVARSVWNHQQSKINLEKARISRYLSALHGLSGDNVDYD